MNRHFLHLLRGKKSIFRDTFHSQPRLQTIVSCTLKPFLIDPVLLHERTNILNQKSPKRFAQLLYC